VAEFGAGSGASRLLSGSLAPHHLLEEAIAEFKGAEAALAFSSGYSTALGAVGALVGPGDVVVVDKLVHACLVDAARLSGAKLRVFRHNDLSHLQDILRWADQRRPAASGPGPSHPAAAPGTLIITESVFSMDGDQAPLRELAQLKEKHGAWLMVDEAHATGLFGKHRRGLAEELGVAADIDIHMGTLGKALGASGGYIAGSTPLIELLINRARSFIFSTAPSPAAAAAAQAAMGVVRSPEGDELCGRLWDRVAQFRAGAAGLAGLSIGSGAAPSAIVPLMLGSEQRAVAAGSALWECGVFAPAIRYPTVPRGKARLRLTFTSSHSPADVNQLLAALAQLETDAPTG
jgi:8-amino-7-oxononanoate synthase